MDLLNFNDVDYDKNLYILKNNCFVKIILVI